MQRLCELFSRGGEAALPNYRPLYNEYQFADALRQEIEAYRQTWSELGLGHYHWKIMDALTNWIGHGYPKRGLYPGHDLSHRLISAISNKLEFPIKWEPYNPEKGATMVFDNACKVVFNHDKKLIEFVNTAPSTSSFNRR